MIDLHPDWPSLASIPSSYRYWIVNSHVSLTAVLPASGRQITIGFKGSCNGYEVNYLLVYLHKTKHFTCQLKLGKHHGECLIVNILRNIIE